MYAANNLDRMLLGKLSGAEALGLYSRAYQLTMFPVDTINSGVGGILMSTLSRLRTEEDRWRRYFLKTYPLMLSVTVPTTVMFALFAEELIYYSLGPKWLDAVPIFRSLAPAALVFSIINPFAPMLVSFGLVGRSLRVAAVLAPFMIVGYILGLRYGAVGVATGLSISMIIWFIPHILVHSWDTHLKNGYCRCGRKAAWLFNSIRIVDFFVTGMLFIFLVRAR